MAFTRLGFHSAVRHYGTGLYIEETIVLKSLQATQSIPLGKDSDKISRQEMSSFVYTLHLAKERKMERGREKKRKKEREGRQKERERKRERKKERERNSERKKRGKEKISDRKRRERKRDGGREE